MAVPPIPAAHLTRIMEWPHPAPASTDRKFWVKCHSHDPGTRIIANLRPKVVIFYTDFGTTS